MKIENKSKRILVAMICVCIGIISKAQTSKESEYPRIGEDCPDYELKNIQYYTKESQKLSDLKGKFVILEFFSSGCASCFAGFPKLNKLVQEFKGKAEIILIGREDKIIESMYEKFRKAQDLDIPVVYDSVIVRRWGIKGFPQVFWIDPMGKIVAISSSASFNSQHVNAFLNGERFKFTDLSLNAKEKRQISFEFQKIFKTRLELEDSSVIYRSNLTKWNSAMPVSSPAGFMVCNSPRFFYFMGLGLRKIYTLAFTGKPTIGIWDSLNGKMYPHPVFELGDSTLFEPNWHTGQNLYNYNLIVPSEKASASHKQQILRDDLERYFQFAAKIERRLMPYWKLTATPKAIQSLKSKGGPEVVKGDNVTTMTLRNSPMLTLLTAIWGYHQLGDPFVDETGITSNIDIEFNVIRNDLEAVQVELAKHGLSLTKAKKVMDVIVVKPGRASELQLK